MPTTVTYFPDELSRRRRWRRHQRCLSHWRMSSPADDLSSLAAGWNESEIALPQMRFQINLRDIAIYRWVNLNPRLAESNPTLSIGTLESGSPASSSFFYPWNPSIRLVHHTIHTFVSQSLSPRAFVGFSTVWSRFMWSQSSHIIYLLS